MKDLLWGESKKLMATQVNLDALVPREDFYETNAQKVKRRDEMAVHDLTYDSFFFSSLRKPDFQRETNDWNTAKIVDLVQSFLDGDLIPALILWQSTTSFTFVIDGSHRLSALAAWINDDYGDGDISKKFFGGMIPDEQLELGMLC
jgi:hypothetical protein